MRQLLPGILLFLFLSPANSQTYRIKMAMIGNSITHGSRLDDPAAQCYPSQLSRMLSEVYGDTVQVMNFGVSGRTMMRSAEKPIWIESRFRDALEYAPDICLILLGTNDSKPYRWDAWGDEFPGDYLAMIDTFRSVNPLTRFILCCPPPIWEGHPYGKDFSNRHNDSILVNYIIPVIKQVAEQTGAVLIDFHTPLKGQMRLFPDKLHPNEEGAGIMAGILFDKLREVAFINHNDVKPE